MANSKCHSIPILENMIVFALSCYFTQVNLQFQATFKLYKFLKFK